MNRFLILSILLFISLGVLSNGVPNTNAKIQELHWDSQGNWTMEIFFTHLNSWEDTIFICTSTDTAGVRIFPNYVEDYFIVTENLLDKPLDIMKSGDAVCLLVWEYEYFEPISDTLFFGDHPRSAVVAPHGNESIVNLGSIVYYNYYTALYVVKEFIVKDISPSIGFHRSPARGTFKGRVLDKYYKPVPYIQLEYDLGFGLQEIWTDEFGFFEDSTMYGMNYEFSIAGSNGLLLDTTITVEPDSMTYCEFILPIKARNNVNGYCLMNNPSLEGTKIIFTPNHDLKPPDTLFTDSTGYFTGMISAGFYYIRYSRPGFKPYYTHYAGGIFEDRDHGTKYLNPGNRIEIPRGPVSGVWDCDTALYWIFEDIWIAEEDTLIIGPGTWIEFMGDFSFCVYGTLLARGEEGAMIMITDGHEGPPDWDYIAFLGEGSSGSLIDYALIKENDSGLIIHDASPTISNSEIDNQETSLLMISGYSAPEILHNHFYDQIISLDYSSPMINGNVFNGTAVGCMDSANVKIYNNDFINCNYSAVSTGWYYQGNMEIFNNIFYKNDWGISTGPYINSLVVKHNLFFESISLIEDEVPGFGVVNRLNFNQDSCDTYFNIFMDPLFVNPNASNYHLQEESPCIDAGALATPYDPDGTIADIGALFYDQLGLFSPGRYKEKDSFKACHFPNPTSGKITFTVTVPQNFKEGKAEIMIFDLSGKLVCNCNPGSIGNKGEYTFHMNIPQNLPQGTYIYNLVISAEKVAANKMILVR